MTKETVNSIEIKPHIFNDFKAVRRINFLETLVKIVCEDNFDQATFNRAYAANETQNCGSNFLREGFDWNYIESNFTLPYKCEHVWQDLRDLPENKNNSKFNKTFAKVKVASDVATDAIGASLKAYKDFETAIAEVDGIERIDDNGVLFTKTKTKTTPETIDQILEQRKKDYGSFHNNSTVTQLCVNAISKGENYENLSYAHLEAFHMIFHKISRLVNGNIWHQDSIDDIIGYATRLQEEIIEYNKLVTSSKEES